MTLDRRTVGWILLGIVLLGAALRLITLGNQSIWLDEAATWVQVMDGLPELFSRTAADNYPPLNNLLIFASVQLFGEGEFALRLPSALLGIGNIIAAYALGSLIAGRTVGLVTALLVATSAFLIWFSQEARMYALLCCSATVFGWAVLRHLTVERSRPWWMLISGIALLYSHPFGPLYWGSILLAAAIFTATQIRRWRPLLTLAGWQVVIGLAFVPWGLILLGRARSLTDGGFWITAPTFDSVTRLFWHILSKSYGMLLVLIGATAALWPSRKGGETGPAVTPLGGSAAFLLIWAFLPVAIGVVVSLVVQPVLVSRYAIASVPPFLTLAGIGLVRLATTRNRRIAVAAVTLILVALALRYGAPDRRPNWRAAAQIIATEAGPTDCFEVSPQYYDKTLFYYLKEPPACRLMERADQTSPPEVARKVFVVASLNGDIDALVAPFVTAGWTREDRRLLRLQFIVLTNPSPPDGPSALSARSTRRP